MATPAQPRWMQALTVAVALVCLVGLGISGTQQRADAGQAPLDQAVDAAQLLERSAVRGHSTSFSGQTLVMEWPNGPDAPATSERTDVTGRAEAVAAVSVDPTHKYDITVGATDHLMDRICVRLDIRLRSSGVLREQVWIDDQSGVFLRRETFEQGQLRRMVSYLSLDLQTPDVQTPDLDTPDLAMPVAAGVPVSNDPVWTVDMPQQRSALRAAGWPLPAVLPGGYRLDHVVVRSHAAGMPLQAVYSDGLYSASLFVRLGTPDFGSLPADSVRVQQLPDRQAFAVSDINPRQVVWSDGRFTMTLVGDPPQSDLLALIDALPAAPAPSAVSRIHDGLQRLAQVVQ